MSKTLNTALLTIITVLLQEQSLAFEQSLHPTYDPWTIINTGSDGTTVMVGLNQLNHSFVNTPKVSERVTSTTYVKMPSMNGEKNIFRFYETTIMTQSMAEKYPDIKSYVGLGIENPSYRATIVLSKNIIMGMTITESGESFFKSFDIYADKNILQVVKELNEEIEFNCNIIESTGTVTRDATDFPDCMGVDDPCNPVGSELVTYRFAGIVTEDVNNAQADSTVEGGLTWLVGMINQANLITIRDFGFQLQIINNNDLIIFTNENPGPEEFKQDCGDPWSTIGCELGEVEAILDSLIGPGGWNAEDAVRVWDYGALFDEGYPGGLAYCPGATSANLPSFYIFIHETGHNFGSPHNSVTENGIRSSIGGSIMHWSLYNTGSMFSTHSIEWAMNYRNTLGPYGNSDYISGYETEQTNNIIPDVVVQESGFIIPKETPFVLEGYSSPMYSEYTFNWESNESSDLQYWTDSNEPELPYFPPNQGSLFTPVSPTTDGYKRTFPDMNSLLDNDYETTVPSPYTGDILTVEKLPFASREMDMRLVVRTNDPYAGSVNHKNFKFFVAGTAGPFRVTSQGDSAVWAVGTEETVTWDVANTDDPDSVNCQTVDILLSLEEDGNFDFTIAESVPNLGTYTFNVPPTTPTSSARLMVRSVDNLFFDINNGVINILNDNVPSISLSDDVIQVSLPIDTLGTVSVGVTNDGEEGSILNYVTYTGSDFLFEEGFDNGNIPEEWTSSTNAECDNPGWFVTNDASSNYFSVPERDGFYISTNDDACGSSSDGSADYLYTSVLSLPNASITLSFMRYFNNFYGHTGHVLVSTDNWENYDEVLTLSQQEGSNNSEWVHETIDLTEYAGENIQIAFHSNDNGGWASGVALDDIRLAVAPSWITSNSSGYIDYMETEMIDININTGELELGEYEPFIVILSLLTDERDTVDIQLTVEDLEVNNPPTVFNLISPADNTELVVTTNDIDQGVELGLVWESSSDIDGDEISYRFLLYNDVYDSSALALIDTVLSDTVLNIPYQELVTILEVLDQSLIDGKWTVFSTDNIDTTMSTDIWNIKIDVSGTMSLDGELIPNMYALHQNYPNPFNPTTTLRYDLPENAMVNITIYDMMGRQVSTLVSSQQNSGYRSVRWNATNDAGSPVSVGLYLYTIEAGQFRQTKKMVLLK